MARKRKLGGQTRKIAAFGPKFYSPKQKNSGRNFSDGLNFATCEQILSVHVNTILLLLF